MSNRFVVLLCALAVFVSVEVRAAGIGIYGQFGSTPTSYNQSIAPIASVFNWSHLLAGGGLVIDTNCSGNAIINYRITVGAAKSFDIKKQENSYPERTTRVQVINTFGLGIVRREAFRLWMGPQIGFTTLYGSYRGDRSDIIMYNASYGVAYLAPYFIDKIQYSMMGGSFGLALGMNFNFKKNITLVIEGSWRYDVYHGMMRTEYFMQDPFSYSYGGYMNISHSSWVKAFADGIYLTVGIMYRFGEPKIEAIEPGAGGLK
jgi:hypothetical protein